MAQWHPRRQCYNRWKHPLPVSHDEVGHSTRGADAPIGSNRRSGYVVTGEPCLRLKTRHVVLHRMQGVTLPRSDDDEEVDVVLLAMLVAIVCTFAILGCMFLL